jgi:cyclopropane-fatty-acyl-phospholipid synthase
MSMRPRQIVSQLLSECDIRINGDFPHDIRVRNEDFYARALINGSLGLGESYMDGWWEAQDLDGVIYRLISAQVDERVWSWRKLAAYLIASIFNLQRRARAFQIGERHYDLGNNLYESMLDKRMIYSCAYWESATTLEEAQRAKLELIFKKLDLKARHRVLDIGCGWGGALQLAASEYGIEGVGVTVSLEQAEYARRVCEGLPVAILLQDYRDLRTTFDRIFSIGMFEHVGAKNYRTYMETVRRCLRPDGRFLLHTIGAPDATNHSDPWIVKYIFPNSMLPSQGQVTRAIDGLFMIDGWQRIGSHYEPTLLAWRRNFETHWPRLKATRDERFYRMWRFYLSASAAAFRARTIDVWQALLSPKPERNAGKRPAQTVSRRASLASHQGPVSSRQPST